MAAARRGLGGSGAEIDALLAEAREIAERTDAELVRQELARFSFEVA